MKVLHMAQSSDKLKELFADLGRPTMRGIRKCPKCLTVNGTRGNSCKNKDCDVIFRDVGEKKKHSVDVCKLSFDNNDYSLYSVRIRDRGPDYRNFVQLGILPKPSDAESVTNQCLNTVNKCYLEHCERIQNGNCSHIESATRCNIQSEPLPIKQSIISTLSIPADCKQVLNMFSSESSDLVQRVSRQSFVVKCNTSSKHPLGYLHILFLKSQSGAKDDSKSGDKKFWCTCKTNKMTPNRDHEQLIDYGNKYCMHYYACIVAFASRQDLANEFSYYLAQAQNYSVPLLGHLQLITRLSEDNVRDVESVESLDSSISVEIMREDISILESIAAADDGTLTNVQGLESVLTADQIIVTSVDDALSFDDPTSLDELDETDQQVCMFSNSQNMELTQNSYPVTNPHEIKLTLAGQSDNEMSSPPLSPVQIVTKRRKETRKEKTIKTLNKRLSKRTKKELKILPKRNHTLRNLKQSMAITTVPMQKEEEKRTATEDFEVWLAAVNERINLSMNFQLNGIPEPLLYYISPEYFEFLRERIIAGGKKKRLPNQSTIIERTDKGPLGTFTKHVFKITNFIHLLQIFSSPIVPLRLTLHFMQIGDKYVEWTPPKGDENSGNPSIIPILHSTYLKIGRDDSSGKDLFPFIIEWTPDLFPQTKYGELKIIYEFGHCGASTSSADERNMAKSMNNRMVQANINNTPRLVSIS